MAATRSDIARWFKEGQEQGATHMVVVCDTFSYDDYPVYVTPGENARDKAAEHDGPEMQKVMEVYSLAKPMEPQLDEFRAFHYD
ncbi:MAG: hypothetical protein AAB605_01500 [Patescibacteria group bacterium]